MFSASEMVVGTVRSASATVTTVTGVGLASPFVMTREPVTTTSPNSSAALAAGVGGLVSAAPGAICASAAVAAIIKTPAAASAAH